MRRKPYTQIGIRRLKCCVSGCENRGEFQWQCCAHDIGMNQMALEYIGHPRTEALVEEYRAKIAGE
jgi:hypothetical protein